MYCIGLTGNIASGKSTAAEIFVNLGADFISADRISKEITTKNELVLTKLFKKFGPKIFDVNKNLNRKLLRNIIFNDPKSRIWLENLLHPIIRQEIERCINISKNNFCVIEIPLLKSKEHYPYLNHIIFINSDQKTKIQRLMQRDNYSYSEAKKILSIQPSIQKYENISDTIIFNNGDFQDLKLAIIKLLNTLNINQ